MAKLTLMDEECRYPFGTLPIENKRSALRIETVRDVEISIWFKANTKGCLIFIPDTLQEKEE